MNPNHIFLIVVLVVLLVLIKALISVRKKRKEAPRKELKSRSVGQWLKGLSMMILSVFLFIEVPLELDENVNSDPVVTVHNVAYAFGLYLIPLLLLYAGLRVLKKRE